MPNWNGGKINHNTESGVSFIKHIFLSIALLLAGAAMFAQNVSFSSADLDKNKITDEIFSAADVTVVNMWETFCPPCIREMPKLAKIGTC